MNDEMRPELKVWFPVFRVTKNPINFLQITFPDCHSYAKGIKHEMAPHMYVSHNSNRT